jgi:hypothetical protein
VATREDLQDLVILHGREPRVIAPHLDQHGAIHSVVPQ